MAGESARESARRQREKAERLARAAEMYERGAEGEEATAAVLATLPEGWSVFHDLRWPGRRFANIDHVVVGPPGVFVVDSKNWSGQVVVDGDVLRQNGRQREAAVAGAADAALALAERLATVDVDRVHPVLSFVREEPLTGWARDVMVCSTTTLIEMLTSRPAVFAPEQVRGIALEVDAVVRPATTAPVTRGASGPVSPRPSSGGRSSGPRTTAARRSPGAAARTRPGRRRGGVGRRLVAAVLTLCFLAVGWSVMVSALQSFGESVSPTCATVNETYPHGVGRRDARDEVVGDGRPVRDFTVDRAAYREHRTLDTDGDGIACER